MLHQHPGNGPLFSGVFAWVTYVSVLSQWLSMGGQSSSSREILLMSGGGRVGAVKDLLGIGGVGMFRAVMYSASELSVVAAAGICGRRRKSVGSVRFWSRLSRLVSQKVVLHRK
jgi:hypothetical protein